MRFYRGQFSPAARHTAFLRWSGVVRTLSSRESSTDSVGLGAYILARCSGLRLVCCRPRPLSLRYVGILRGKDLPMLRTTLGLGCIAAFLLASPTPRLRAAEFPPRPVGHAHVRAPAHCGPCGCLLVTYVHHRAFGSTYGLGFDPRNYDQPHFYLTRLHAYPRYSVDGYPAPGAC